MEKLGGLALGSMLIPLVDSFTWLEVNLRAFAFAIFVSHWSILAFEDSLKRQNVLQLWIFRYWSYKLNLLHMSLPNRWFFQESHVYVVPTDQLRSRWLILVASQYLKLQMLTALPLKYSFVVTAVTEFAMVPDLLITTSGKLSCIGWRKSSLQNFTTFFYWLT